MNHPAMPQDGIPYWDFDSSAIPDDYRDASAAAIMASGLIVSEQNLYICFSPFQIHIYSNLLILKKPTMIHYIISHVVMPMSLRIIILGRISVVII